MNEQTVYIRMYPRMKVAADAQLTIADVAEIVAPDSLKQKVGQLFLHNVRAKDDVVIVIDLMQIVQLIHRKIGAVDIHSFGATETVIHVRVLNKRLQPLYFLFVWMLLFVGSAVTIMNFHEDVSMGNVHERIHWLITGIETKQPFLLQIPYSIGLGVGMIIFFNHLFKKRLHEEPSPLEIEMFQYEQMIDQYVVANEKKQRGNNVDAN